MTKKFTAVIRRAFRLRLSGLWLRAFSYTFAHIYEQEPFQEFLRKTYGPKGDMERDLCDLAIFWRVAIFDGHPIGYA